MGRKLIYLFLPPRRFDLPVTPPRPCFLVPASPLATCHNVSAFRHIAISETHPSSLVHPSFCPIPTHSSSSTSHFPLSPLPFAPLYIPSTSPTRWLPDQCAKLSTSRPVSVVTRLVPSSGEFIPTNLLCNVRTALKVQGSRFGRARYPGRRFVQGYLGPPARAHQCLLQRGRCWQVCAPCCPH